MKGCKKNNLHQTPDEFAVAAEVRDSWCWQDHQERHERKNKRDSERIMPAHRPPSRKVVGRAMATERLYESETAYRKRLAKWYKRYGKDNHSSST